MNYYKKCEYRKDCKEYDKESICCTFLYKICLYRRKAIHKEELRQRQQQKTLDDKIRETKDFLDLWGNL